MNITIVDKSTGVSKLDYFDGIFYCQHNDITIEEPCCSPFSTGSSGYIECGCGGNISIYCNDCDNKDLTDEQVNDIIENYYG